MKIALTFSGGGFRAAAFSLGSLSLLQQIRCCDTTLLDQVSVLSTVSGGTITGARLALGLKQDESFENIYHKLYHFLSNSKLVQLALERLGSDDGWNENRVRNLITAFADIYDKELFDGAKFGVLMKDAEKGTFQHLSFNATDFTNALQFRFQWSEKILQPKVGEPERGIIGNNGYRLPFEVAKDIRMADILAASSCFPGGFEPINFPDDFVWTNNTDLSSLEGNKYPVGLMDGGIVDNQGIEPVLLAENRMKRNRADIEATSAENVLDLIIVCEVASPYMNSFQASQQHNNSWIKRQSPVAFAWVNGALLTLSLIAGIFTYLCDSKVGLVLSSVVFTLTVSIFLLFTLFKSLATSSGIPHEFLAPLGKLLKLKIFIYENLIANRFRSVMMLTMNVFLKHVRRLNYNRLYHDESWKNRRIMNAIYELKTEEDGLQKKVAKGLLPPELLPSELMQKNSDLAASMGTTLWFTKDELESQKMLDAIIACGQYTMCWNLLEYIHLLKKDNSNTNEAHQQLITCESQLMKLWECFLKNPKFLLPTNK